MQVAENKIGLIGAIAIIVGTVIGASIFILLGPIAGQTGPSLFLAYFVAFLPALFGSLFYAQLGSAMPTNGGSYFYSKRLLNPLVGYITTISLILGGMGAIIMLALGFGEYLQFFLPQLPVKVTAIAIVLVLFIINILGLKTAEIAQIAMTIWIIIGLLIFAIPGLFHIEPQNLTPLMPNGLGSFLMGSALAVYSYVGYGVISEIGGNIKDPKKNLPRAIFISLGIVVVLYVLVSVVAVGVIPWEQLASSGASVAEAATLFLPAPVILFISIGALFATVTTINAIMMTIPGDFIALAKEGILSEKNVTKTVNQTMVIPISILSGVGVLGILSGLSVDYFATITIVGLLLNTVVLGFALFYLPAKEPKLYNEAPFKMSNGILRLVVIFGVLLNIAFIILAVLDVPSIIVVYIVWITAGYLLHRRRIPKRSVKAQNVMVD